MKVRSVDTRHVVLPLDEPIGFALGEIHSFGVILVRITTNEGPAGESLIFTLNDVRSRVLREMVESLASLVVGADPAFTAGIWDKAWRSINFIGHKGVSIMGISAIDSALWDLNARAAGLPLSHMLGAARSSVPAYHSGGLWLSMKPAALAEQAGGMVASGFRTIKLRLGAPTLREDRERIKAVREAIGPSVGLMVDANQGLTESEAIRRGRMLDEFDITWFEEPLPAWDLEGLGRVKSAISTPIASGETDYTRYAFRQMLELRAADTLMPDLQRVGGVSEFMRVARMAEAYDVPVSSHLFTEMSIQLMAALPGKSFIEYMPWFEPLYRERIELRDGDALVPDRPGWGFTLDEERIAHLERRTG
ncbi:mandelate racemase/muconate lactonizing enzyme family protein [Bosea sp. NPDC055594]